MTRVRNESLGDRWHRVLGGAAGLLAMVLATALAVSCGGGGVGSGGTGAPVADGLVTGFGSVIVDGVRYDDAQASVLLESTDGSTGRGSLALGHHVEMSFSGEASSGQGVAQTITIRPDLVGAIDTLASDGFRLLGQTVRVNTDATAGPVTQFGGALTGLQALRAGTAVAVHGASLQDAGSDLRVLLAARIEPVSSLGGLRLSGVVEEVRSDRFRVGQAWIRVPGTLPAVGRYITVRAPVTAWNAATSTLDATGLTQREREASSSGSSMLGGTVSQLDTAASSFELQGVRVHFAQSSIEGGALANGRYVRVQGQYAGAMDFTATQIKLRSVESEIELHGSVLGWNAQTARFTIRGQVVDASGLSAAGRACLVEQNYVEVEGRGTAQGVIATRVTCSTSGSGGGSEDGSDGSAPAPVGAVIEVVGTVTQLQASQRQFVLARDASLGALTVNWSDRTEFELQGATLANGLRLRVEGDVETGGGVRAREIKVYP